MAARTLTPKEVALEFGTDARTLRKFLRSDAKAKGTETPGKGSRWAIPATRMKSMRKGFDAWNAANEAKKAEATETPEVTETVNEDAEGDNA